MDNSILAPEQQIVCEFCDPETSRPALVTIHPQAPICYARELLEPDEDGFRICSFSVNASRRVGAYLAKEAIKFWPNGTLLIEDFGEKSFWIVRLGETDPSLAFEKCEETPCCGRYVIGEGTFPWQYDEVHSPEFALSIEPW
jgi:hypothetical protein